MKKKLVIFSLLTFVVILILGGYLLYERKTIYNNISINLKSPLSYCDKPSYTNSDSIHVFYHSKDSLGITLYKLTDTLELLEQFELPPLVQSNVYSPKSGHIWKKPFTFKINDLDGGYFVLKLKNKNGTYYQPVLIQSHTFSEISIVSSYNTWQAYNSYGGKSNYYDDLKSEALKFLEKAFPKQKSKTYIPFNRPFSFMPSDFFGATQPMENLSKNTGLIIDSVLNPEDDFKPQYDTIATNSQFLKGEWNLIGYLEKNNISYNTYTDYDFALNPKILESKLIIFHTHSEYWSDEMIGNLIYYLNNGGKVIFASGNNIYRKITFNEFGYTVNNELITDSIVRNLIGTYYSTITYPKKSSFKAVNSNHWVFNKTNISQGDLFSEQGSGWETDKMGIGSNNLELLAVGTNKSGPAHMILKNYPKGGWVFNASSMTFCETIPRDSVVQRMLLNLIENAIAQ